MFLYRIETNGATKAYEWWRRKDEAAKQAKAIAEAGIDCQLQKIDVPTKAEELVEFLNLADATAGNLAEAGISVEVVKKFGVEWEEA